MKKNSITLYCYLDSPLGKLMLAGDENFLKMIEFPDHKKAKEIEKSWLYSESRFKCESDELIRYFEGELKKFSIRCQITGTAFQNKVLNELNKIHTHQLMQVIHLSFQCKHRHLFH